MLSKPEHGWTIFSLGKKCYDLSYMTNIPLDWLEKAIVGLETLLPFEVYGDCEPGKMICTVDFSECRIVFENGKHKEEAPSCEVVLISMLDFCKVLYEDISTHIDDWEKWNTSYHLTKEDLLSRLERLQKLIQVKANCFI